MFFLFFFILWNLSFSNNMASKDGDFNWCFSLCSKQRFVGYEILKVVVRTNKAQQIKKKWLFTHLTLSSTYFLSKKIKFAKCTSISRTVSSSADCNEFSMCIIDFLLQGLWVKSGRFFQTVNSSNSSLVSLKSNSRYLDNINGKVGERYSLKIKHFSTIQTVKNCVCYSEIDR